ncbi:hypothetical protein IHV25_00895 [Phaeovibrio sulfidiphilus]|uniref:Uncharacterized protein n=1 Tax=Phaeovibrio sulfidiphilus TaxID=1220600 RepID=A0A8J7CCV5_9PROT|nr:hypothetical protein [Phaeovibrio sulfidiphilus]MBE1236214.1 hypothetical protein [Phaeovibrio sulfidiphilus]
MPLPSLSRNASVGVAVAVLSFGGLALAGPQEASAQSKPLATQNAPAPAKEAPEAERPREAAPSGPQAPGARPQAPQHRTATPLSLQNRALEPRCSWTGERIVSLLVREDAESAERFLAFYNRFDCPPARIAEAFSCVLQSPVAGATSESLGGLSLASVASACWSDPTLAFPLPRDEDKPAPSQRKK